MAGWIKLSRDIVSHWIWQDEKRLKWWLDLLFMAAYEKRKKLLKKEGKFIELQPGETDASYAFLAERWGVDKRVVRRFIELLEADGMVTHQAYHSYAIITICNYESYQKIGTPEGTPEGTQVKNIISKESKEYFVVDACAREEFLSMFFAPDRRAAIEGLCMNLHTDIATLEKTAGEVVVEWEATSQPLHRDLSDAYRHLVNQIRIKLSKSRNDAPKNSLYHFSTNQYDHGTTTGSKQHIDARAARQRQFEEYIIAELNSPDIPEPDVSGLL